ncbi:MAG: D-alanine--D-alanine ligase family protein [Acidimicrobiia bacterium]
MSLRRLRVLLLFGGRSAEHEVSCVSAVAVARGLDEAGYEVVPMGITREGRWLLAGEARAALDKGRDALPESFAVEGEPVFASDCASLEPGGSGGRFDVAFPVLHGPFGEDGTVQGFLELAGIPYVGSGVVGSAVGMDKVMMKRAFLACGLPSPCHLALREDQRGSATAARVEEELGYPCFVKPANLGSSVGVSKANDRGALEVALDEAFGFDDWALVEESVSGREIEVSVLGDRPPVASLPGEVVPADEFYSYQDKYFDGKAELHAPARLEPRQVQEAQALAIAGFEACRGEAMARVDLFLEESRSGGRPGRGFLLNEVNTIPGFTPISMYPKMWEATGLTPGELVDELVDAAISRHQHRAGRLGRPR